MENPTRHHYPFLDLLRSVAALLVLFGHARAFYFEGINKIERVDLFTAGFYFLTSLQHEAVVLFFVVSGYLVGGGLWQRFEIGRFDAWSYAVNRFIRIYIVFLPALFLVGLTTVIAFQFFADTQAVSQLPVQPFSTKKLICHLACLQGVYCSVLILDPPLWSLSYEWILYLIAPFFFASAYAANFSTLWRCVALLVLILTTITVLPPFVQYSWFVFWVAGACAAFLSSRSDVSLSFGLVGLGVGVAACLLSRLHVLPQILTDLAVALGFAAAIACPRIKSWSPAPTTFAYVAGFSYSLYVIHYPLAILSAAVLQRAGWPPYLSLPGPMAYAGFIITVGVAILSAMLFAALTEKHTEIARRAILGQGRTRDSGRPGSGK